MDVIVGTTAIRVFQYLRDGAPTAGATLTYSLRDPLGTLVVNAVAATDAGDGTYSFQLDGSTYFTTAGTAFETWAGSYSGDDILVSGPVLVGYLDTAVAMTRRELRWDVAEHREDHWTDTVSASSATSLTLPNLPAPLNDWEGGEVYVYAGTGRGQARRITASGDNTGVLTVPTWTVNPTAGALVEVHKTKTVAQYNSAIKQAIRQAARYAVVPMTDVSLLQDDAVLEYATPAGMVWLTHVDSEDAADTNEYTEIPRTAGLWSAGRGYLRVKSPVDGSRLRLRGWRYPQVLEYDEQYCDLDPTYIAYIAASLLSASQIQAPTLDRSASAATSAYWQALGVAQLPRNALVNAIRVGGD